MASLYSVPGVYYEPRPRVAPRPLSRTDVVGFVGFEPRVRDGSTPCRLLGTPPTGHDLRVDVSAFELPPELLGGLRVEVRAARDFCVSKDAGTIPMPPGGAASFALVAALKGAEVELLSVPGPVSSTNSVGAATNEAIAAVAGDRPWVRIADIEVRRSAAGDRIFPSVLPTLPPVRCDDIRDFERRMGTNVEDGALLARGVRAFFANGGARCYVVTTRRPRFFDRADDTVGMAAALEAMVGVAGASEAEATGLERLLRIAEVAIVDVPDLYARQVESVEETWEIPPADVNACFRACDETFGPAAPMTIRGTSQPLGPLFEDTQVLAGQRALLVRCAADRWRVLLLLAAPLEFDFNQGGYRGPSAERAAAWRMSLDGAVDDLSAACAAFYHPWVLTQERVGAPTQEVPPTSLVAGVIARRDLARGPHVAPANETLAGVVGLSPSLDDATLGQLYETPLHINVMRPFAGAGIQVWGARTLSRDRFMRYLPVRRCLSAIERRVLAALQPLVFEPNSTMLWFQITQAVFGVLLPIFESGALRGAIPEEAFFVRCDDTNNPPESVMVGQVLCEVGVAIAAPLEFIVFRVGRREAVVEVLESP